MAQITPTEELYASLKTAYDHFNKALFDGELPDVVLTIDNNPRTRGYFSPQRWTNKQGELVHQVSMNSTRFAADPLISVLSTLVHEACHVWQQEFGNPGRGKYHNEQWVDKMKEIGLKPVALDSKGLPNGKETGDRVSHQIVRDGKFVVACTELIKDGIYDLAWTDRWIGVPSSEHALFADDTDEAECEKSEKSERPKTPEDARLILTKLIDNANDAAKEALDGLGLDADSTERLSLPFAATLSGDAIDDSGALRRLMGGQAKKRTRHKYQCHLCGITAQASPGLSLLCGDCEMPLLDFHRLEHLCRLAGITELHASSICVDYDRTCLLSYLLRLKDDNDTYQQALLALTRETVPRDLVHDAEQQWPGITQRLEEAEATFCSIAR